MAATTPGRSMTWPGWWSAAWRWPPRPGIWPAGSRSAGPWSRACCHAPRAVRCGCSPGFVREVGIDSRDGFEIGIELTAKAKRLRLPVAEIPTIWLDRPAGVSNFKVAAWLPRYLRWYRFAFGGQLTPEQIRTRAPQKGR